jgi:hypothetical protein
MRGTLVLALDRTGRLQTACWSITGQTVRPPQFSIPSPCETAGDLDGKLRLRRRANDQNRRSRKSANSLLSQKEENS